MCVTKGEPPRPKAPNFYSAELQEYIEECLVHDHMNRPRFSQPSRDMSRRSLLEHKLVTDTAGMISEQEPINPGLIVEWLQGLGLIHNTQELPR